MNSKIVGTLMQNLVFPAMLLPTRSQATKLVKRMRQFQRWPLEKLRNRQLDRVRSLIEVASQESIFYREKFARSGLSNLDLNELSDLSSFPITTKSDIEANFPDRMVIASRRNSDWQYVGTRGTTRRIMVVHDFERRDLGRAAVMVALTEDSPYCYGAKQISIPPDACSVHCGVESTRADSVAEQFFAMATRRIPWNRESVSDLRGLVMDQWVQRSCTLPPLPLEGSEETLRDCVAAIRKHRPLQLVALPEYLRTLAEYILRSGDTLPPIAVIRPMGANFPKSWTPEIESAFGGQLREHYGSREMGPMAFDCAKANGMHLLMDSHLIEIVKTDGTAAKSNELGKVLVTDLHNFAMPIIRYEIGDLARVNYESCSCGRTSPRIFLEGRVEDALVTCDGRILTSDAVSNFFTNQKHVRDFELTEKRNGVWSLKVVPVNHDQLDSDALVIEFLAWAGESRSVTVRTVSTIRPEASGKFRHVKNQSDRRFGFAQGLPTC